MTSIARKNLLEDIPRFIVAQVGILFAVSLVTIQTGLQSGFTQSTSKLIERSTADIWLADKTVEHIGLTLPIRYELLAKARQVKGVERAEAILLRTAIWKAASPAKIAAVTLVGADPEGLLFSPIETSEGKFSDLKQEFSLIADRASLNKLGLDALSQSGKVNDLPAKLVGIATKSQTIVFDNMIFTSLENAHAYLASLAPSDQSPIPQALNPDAKVNYLLIKAAANEDLELLKSRLNTISPNLKAYSRAEMITLTQQYWQERSGIGFILGLGAAVGIVVGVVIVGQILYASVSDHLKEFGTLKAMGASDWFLYRIILEQSLWMAILGYVPGMSLCVGLAFWTATAQGITILITPASAGVVLGITVVMCMGSAIFAIQKVMLVDPAIVFKS
jgi:putative ABC transport system permease protein